MTADARIGILGGTFDPVHTGHLEAGVAALTALALDRVLFLPSRIPPHRTNPAASAYHRFAMTAMAVQGHDAFEVSDLELSASGTSYTWGTLERLQHAGLRRTQIFFITGADAFADIETWYRFPDVLDLSHFIIVSRAGREATTLRGALPALASRMRAGTPEAAQASKPTIFLVDWRTPDVSSTDVRQRVRAGEALAGLVAPAVERHIRRHHLYSTELPDGRVGAAADHLHGEH